MAVLSSVCASSDRQALFCSGTYVHNNRPISMSYGVDSRNVFFKAKAQRSARTRKVTGGRFFKQRAPVVHIRS
jgi:hypothetical protein